MDALFSPSGLLALITLTFLEIALGVDNVIFISILSSNLPGPQQSRAPAPSAPLPFVQMATVPRLRYTVNAAFTKVNILPL